MHSWVFRHRDRLRTIFGLPEPPAPPRIGYSEPEPYVAPRRKQGAPGTVRWTKHYAVIEPMPPR